MINGEIQCPTCGYYCNGTGGFGCIDKPAILRSKLDDEKLIIDNILKENSLLKKLLSSCIIEFGHTQYCQTKNMPPSPEVNCICHVALGRTLTANK